jgi:hypothetical protein
MIQYLIQTKKINLFSLEFPHFLFGISGFVRKSNQKYLQHNPGLNGPTFSKSIRIVTEKNEIIGF